MFGGEDGNRTRQAEILQGFPGYLAPSPELEPPINNGENTARWQHRVTENGAGTETRTRDSWLEARHVSSTPYTHLDSFALPTGIEPVLTLVNSQLCAPCSSRQSKGVKPIFCQSGLG